eukprot:gb/GECG01014659.1/.p1 GENE.gb/GECG01014659.1/~~gb/GECG01014659.1/.p1  ORF type:complete len:211 (+),score=31.82 gb/GECG01014659.1/:1-633(+)
MERGEKRQNIASDARLLQPLLKKPRDICEQDDECHSPLGSKSSEKSESGSKNQVSGEQTFEDCAHRVKRHVEEFLEGIEEMDSSKVTATVKEAVSGYAEIPADPNSGEIMREDLQHLNHVDRERKMAAIRAHRSRLRRQQRENWLNVLNPVLLESTQQALLCLNGKRRGTQQSSPDINMRLRLQVGSFNTSLTVRSNSFKLTQSSLGTHY